MAEEESIAPTGQTMAQSLQEIRDEIDAEVEGIFTYVNPEGLVQFLYKKYISDLARLTQLRVDKNYIDTAYRNIGIDDISNVNIETCSGVIIPRMKDSVKKYMMNAITNGQQRTNSTSLPVGVIGIGCPGSGKTLSQLISLALLISIKTGNTDMRTYIMDTLKNYCGVTDETKRGPNPNPKPEMILNIDQLSVKGCYSQIKDRLTEYLNGIGYITIDQDDIIEYFFNLNEYRSIVFHLTEFLFNKALELGMNIIYASTGRDPGHIQRVNQAFIDSGYINSGSGKNSRVILSIMDTATEICREQITERLISAYTTGDIGRDVPDDFFYPSCTQIKNLIDNKYKYYPYNIVYLYTRSTCALEINLSPQEEGEVIHRELSRSRSGSRSSIGSIRISRSRSRKSKSKSKSKSRSRSRSRSGSIDRIRRETSIPYGGRAISKKSKKNKKM
jgi:hypothetical protein